MDSAGNSQGLSRRVKATLATAGLLGALAFVYAQYSVTTAAVGRPQSSPSPRAVLRPPTGPERDEMKKQLISRLGLSEEQQAKLEELEQRFPPPGAGGAPPDPRAMGERMRAVEEILTEPQREQFHAFLRAHMAERLQRDLSRLPPEEQAKFRAKLEDRIASGAFPSPGGPRP